MKKSLFTFLCIFFLTGIFSQNFGHLEIHYKSIFGDHFESDWQSVKEQILAIFPDSIKSERIENIYSKKHLSLDALASLKEREFSNEEKVEIEEFLVDFTILFLEDKSQMRSAFWAEKLQFLRIHPATTKYNSIHFTPLITVQILLAKNRQKGFETLKYVWNHYLNKNNLSDYALELRRGYIQYLWLFYKEKESINLIKELRQNSITNLNPDELKMIERAIFSHEVSKIEDERFAWEILWQNSKTNSKSLDKMLTYDSWHEWSPNIILMRELFPNLSLCALNDIIESSNDPKEKYIFLGCGCGHINQFGHEIPTEEVEQFERLFRKLMKNYPTLLREPKGKTQYNGTINCCRYAGVTFE